jgi:hypothetical protein
LELKLSIVVLKRGKLRFVSTDTCFEKFMVVCGMHTGKMKWFMRPDYVRMVIVFGVMPANRSDCRAASAVWHRQHIVFGKRTVSEKRALSNRGMFFFLSRAISWLTVRDALSPGSAE